jgi:FRG domain-containing protein
LGQALRQHPCRVQGSLRGRGVPSADLPRGQSGQPSILEPLAITTWQNFKEYVTRLEPYRYIFRGQTNTWRLRTPFHRTGRGDMRRFLIEDIPTLHRHLSGRTSHLFDLTNPIQNAAFLHLVQHHGYPTGSGLRVRAAARPHRRCRADTRTAVTRRGSGKSGGRDVA